MFELVGDEFSDRKGVTGATIRSTLSEALPTIAEPGMVFMQDNAPVHTSHVVQKWLGDFVGKSDRVVGLACIFA